MQKLYSIYLKLMALSVLIAGTVACDNDEEPGDPVITNVRVTERDSSITAGEFNVTLAIQGNNLARVTRVLFNDVEAMLNPVLVTNTNIICSVPDSPPGEVTNTITVVTRSGHSASYDFNVILPKPVINGVYNEFAHAGEENIILGQYLFLISSVMVGETEAEIISYTDTEITFVTPEGVGTEYITITGEGGTTTSTFRLNETEGNMVNFDIPATTWGSDVCWGGSERVEPANSELPVLSGRYAQIKGEDLPVTGYQDNWVFATCWFDFGLNPGSHEEKVLKFEAFVAEPWKQGHYVIRIGTEDGGLYVYFFEPWDTDQYRSAGLTTDGWKTFYIPVSQINRHVETDGLVQVEPAEKIADVASIRDIRFDFANPGDDAAPISTFHVAIDNVRIVDL